MSQLNKQIFKQNFNVTETEVETLNIPVTMLWKLNQIFFLFLF
jgi:hypothetical protein